VSEERISGKFETEERLREVDDYLRGHGIRKVGHRDVFTIEETQAGIRICGGSATTYYFKDREPEQLSVRPTCVLLPKRFLPQLKAMLEKAEGNKPRWVGPSMDNHTVLGVRGK